MVQLLTIHQTNSDALTINGAHLYTDLYVTVFFLHKKHLEISHHLEFGLVHDQPCVGPFHHRRVAMTQIDLVKDKLMIAVDIFFLEPIAIAGGGIF